MKHTVYAVIAAALSMLATSGALVVATAAPTRPTASVQQQQAEQALAAEIDVAVARQLAAVKARLQLPTATP